MGEHSMTYCSLEHDSELGKRLLGEKALSICEDPARGWCCGQVLLRPLPTNPLWLTPLEKKQLLMPQIFEFLQSTWETWMGFPALGFGLALLQVLFGMPSSYIIVPAFKCPASFLILTSC